MKTKASSVVACVLLVVLASAGAEPTSLRQLVDPRFRHGYSISVLAFRPDGKVLAAAGGPMISLWDPATGRKIGHIPVDRGPKEETGLAFAPDGQVLAIGLGDRVLIW